jgi:hypothetical protein
MSETVSESSPVESNHNIRDTFEWRFALQSDQCWPLLPSYLLMVCIAGFRRFGLHT